MRQPHVGGDVDRRGAVRPLRREVRLVHLGRAAEGRADPLVPADDGLLLLQVGAVPHLDVHPDPSGDEVGAARQPRGLARHVLRVDPHVLGEGLRVLGLDVGRAVLEAEEVARGGLARRRRRGAPEAELAPAHRDGAEAEAHEVAHGVHGDLRVVGARLDADVAARARLVEVVAGEGGQLAQRLRAAVLDAEPLEEARAVADGDRQARRRQVHRLAGVLGDLPRPAADHAAGGGLGADRHPLGGAGPRGEHRAQLVDVVGRHVQRHEVHAVLGGGGDAGLVLAAEGHDAVVGVRRGIGRGSARVRRPGGADRETGREDRARGRPDEGATAHPFARAAHLELPAHCPSATTPATFATSSLSASRASESSLTSASDRSV